MSDQAKKFETLLKKIKKSYKPEEFPPRDGVTQLIIGFLTWETTRDQAEDALGALMEVMVDVNELRITHVSELVEIIGKKYPFAQERIIRLREALNAVYNLEHGVTMKSIDGKGKKEQKAYLDALPAVPSYVKSQVMLLCYGGHAMPVDRRLAFLLEQEGVVSDGGDLPAVESFLLKQVKASDCLESHLYLQAWADDQKVAGLKMKSTVIELADKPRGSVKKTTKKASKSHSESAAKKSSKKTTAKKSSSTATKKTAAKKTTAKKTAAKKSSSKQTKKKTSKKK
ncbi:hypothetical protein KS4_09780 [Poriferisphaera corsica]|uniref:Uncharacterized protein n=1 Tax=Poriferisphaera corsica TaxID=2528020 RepID=A0A517YRT9_9BACT|nr:hypothetical protein [Poriferisphaera corsica]QDU32939.1 hypothetical protein KS4_09780 [Poriferisphaera corsica]